MLPPPPSLATFDAQTKRKPSSTGETLAGTSPAGTGETLAGTSPVVAASVWCARGVAARSRTSSTASVKFMSGASVFPACASKNANTASRVSPWVSMNAAGRSTKFAPISGLTSFSDETFW